MENSFLEWYEFFCEELHKNKHERKIDKVKALVYFEEGLSVNNAVYCYLKQFKYS